MKQRGYNTKIDRWGLQTVRRIDIIRRFFFLLHKTSPQDGLIRVVLCLPCNSEHFSRSRQVNRSAQVLQQQQQGLFFLQ